MFEGADNAEGVLSVHGAAEFPEVGFQSFGLAAEAVYVQFAGFPDPGVCGNRLGDAGCFEHAFEHTGGAEPIVSVVAGDLQIDKGFAGGDTFGGTGGEKAKGDIGEHGHFDGGVGVVAFFAEDAVGDGIHERVGTLGMPHFQEEKGVVVVAEGAESFHDCGFIWRDAKAFEAGLTKRPV